MLQPHDASMPFYSFYWTFAENVVNFLEERRPHLTCSLYYLLIIADDIVDDGSGLLFIIHDDNVEVKEANAPATCHSQFYDAFVRRSGRRRRHDCVIILSQKDVKRILMKII